MQPVLDVVHLYELSKHLNGVVDLAVGHRHGVVPPSIGLFCAMLRAPKTSTPPRICTLKRVDMRRGLTSAHRSFGNVVLGTSSGPVDNESVPGLFLGNVPALEGDTCG